MMYQNAKQQSNPIGRSLVTENGLINKAMSQFGIGVSQDESTVASWK
jgi:hypothetical protein